LFLKLFSIDTFEVCCADARIVVAVVDAAAPLEAGDSESRGCCSDG